MVRALAEDIRFVITVTCGICKYTSATHNKASLGRSLFSFILCLHALQIFGSSPPGPNMKNYIYF